jgi:3-deoxy-D-manno-octulosonic acid (KDO) 8-phosphate synthase
MDEAIHPVQLEGLRRMTPARKLEMVCELYHAGIALRVAGMRLQHPDWPEEKLEWEARRALRYAGT